MHADHLATQRRQILHSGVYPSRIFLRKTQWEHSICILRFEGLKTCFPWIKWDRWRTVGMYIQLLVFTWWMGLDNAVCTGHQEDPRASRPSPAVVVALHAWGGAADTQPHRDMAPASHPLVQRQSTWTTTQVCSFHGCGVEIMRTQSQCPGHWLSWGSWNKITQIAWLIKTWNLFLIGQECSMIREPVWLAPGQGPLPDHTRFTFLHLLTLWKESEKTFTDLFMRAPRSWPNYLLKTPPPKASHWELGYIAEGHTHSVHSRHTPAGTFS